jgi:hypothetical protein
MAMFRDVQPSHHRGKPSHVQAMTIPPRARTARPEQAFGFVLSSRMLSDRLPGVASGRQLSEEVSLTAQKIRKYGPDRHGTWKGVAEIGCY